MISDGISGVVDSLRRHTRPALAPVFNFIPHAQMLSTRVLRRSIPQLLHR